MGASTSSMKTRQLEEEQQKAARLEAALRREKHANVQLRDMQHKMIFGFAGIAAVGCIGIGLLLRRRVREIVESTERSLASVHQVQIEDVRRRAARQIENAEKFSVGALARDLLPVADSLELARLHALAEKGSSISSMSSISGAVRAEATPNSASTSSSSTSTALRGLLEGVELTEKSLLTVFERHGIEKQDVNVGDMFDPQVHEAVRRVEDQLLQPGQITEVFRSGYTIRDRVLRAAQVVVVVNPDPPAPEVDSATPPGETDTEEAVVKEKDAQDARSSTSTSTPPPTSDKKTSE